MKKHQCNVKMWPLQKHTITHSCWISLIILFLFIWHCHQYCVSNNPSVAVIQQWFQFLHFPLIFCLSYLYILFVFALFYYFIIEVKVVFHIFPWHLSKGSKNVIRLTELLKQTKMSYHWLFIVLWHSLKSNSPCNSKLCDFHISFLGF